MRAVQQANTMEAMRTWLQGLHAMRQVNEQALRQWSTRHADATRRLRGAATPADLAVLQFALLTEDAAACARYWQDLAGTVLETQTELLACGAQLVDVEPLFLPFAPRVLHC